MRGPWRLVTDDGEEPIHSVEELRRAFATARASSDPSLLLTSPGGDALIASFAGDVVGLELALGRGVFRPVAEGPPSGASLDEDGDVTFLIGGQESAWPGDRCLSTVESLRVAEFVVRCGGLPDWLRWEEG